jgi:Putative DNA-binding domain
VIPTAFDAINELHIQALVDTERVEDRYIDFKLDFSRDHPWDDLAADVCAFANTDGGDIVIGVAEVDRMASRVLGVACDRATDRRALRSRSGRPVEVTPLTGRAGRVHGYTNCPADEECLSWIVLIQPGTDLVEHIAALLG